MTLPKVNNELYRQFGHAWDRFITPRELTDLLERYRFNNYEMRGVSIRSNPIAAWLNFRRRVQGKITFKELGQRLGLHESDDLRVSYMGAASKRGMVARDGMMERVEVKGR